MKVEGNLRDISSSRQYGRERDGSGEERGGWQHKIGNYNFVTAWLGLGDTSRSPPPHTTSFSPPLRQDKEINIFLF